jgi:hypothetical protein
LIDARKLVLALRGSLVPVPASGEEGICSICHSSAEHGEAMCAPCRQAQWMDPPEVLPITMSIHGGLVHHHLRAYKDGRSAAERERMSLRLAGLLSVFLVHHGSCIGGFDYVAAVPSFRGVALDAVLARTRLLEGRFRQVIEIGSVPQVPRSIEEGRYVVRSRVAGDRVLLLDDTFTTGASIFSAVIALRRSGAQVVGPVVIGRHVQPEWPHSSELLSWLKKRPWDEERCARCNGERRGEE